MCTFLLNKWRFLFAYICSITFLKARCADGFDSYGRRRRDLNDTAPQISTESLEASTGAGSTETNGAAMEQSEEDHTSDYDYTDVNVKSVVEGADPSSTTQVVMKMESTTTKSLLNLTKDFGEIVPVTIDSQINLPKDPIVTSTPIPATSSRIALNLTKDPVKEYLGVPVEVPLHLQLIVGPEAVPTVLPPARFSADPYTESATPQQSHIGITARLHFGGSSALIIIFFKLKDMKRSAAPSQLLLQ